VLLHEVLGLDRDDVVALAEAAASLRGRRIGNGSRNGN
jgi:hypothetical protein